MLARGPRFLLLVLLGTIWGSVTLGAQEKDVSSAVKRTPQQKPQPDGVTSVKLSLEETIQIALANSFAVRLARLDRSIQKRQETIEKAAFDPSVTAAADYSKNREP